METATVPTSILLLNQQLVTLDLCMRPFHHFITDDLNQSLSAPIHKVDLYIFHHITEQQKTSILDLQHGYGVIGIVQKRKVLDKTILNEFRSFLANGYQHFNQWWQAGRYDKGAYGGILIKEGKMVMNVQHVRGNSICPIRIFPSSDDLTLMSGIRELLSLRETRVRAAKDFGEQLSEKLDIQLLPELSDPRKGIIHLVADSQQFSSTCLFESEMYPLMALSGLFCAYSYPQLRNFQIRTRFTYVHADRFITEHSDLYQFQLKELALRNFMYRNTILSANDIQQKELKNGEKILDRVVSFVRDRVTIIEQHAHPIDK